MFPQILKKNISSAVAAGALLVSGAALSHGTEETLYINATIGPGLFHVSDVYYADEVTNFLFHNNLTNGSGVAWSGITVRLEGWDWGADAYLPSPAGGVPNMLENDESPFHVRLNGTMQMGWSSVWSPVSDQVSFSFTGFQVGADDVLHIGGMEVENFGTDNWRLHFEAMPAVTAVPLPAPLALLASGILSLAGVTFRRKR